MEPSVLKEVAAELEDLLAGGVVSKVHQSSARTIVVKIFSRGADRRLLISAEPGAPRAHLTEERPENPPAPPRFCAYLRSRITNARVDYIASAPGERILRMGLRKRQDDGYAEMTLIAELTGKSSNIILIDSAGVVCDALKRFPAESSVRAVEPGFVLAPLPAPERPAGAVAREAAFERLAGESWNEAADRYYTALARLAAFASEKARLGRAARKALKKARRKLTNIRRDNAGAEDGLEGYALGELLITNLHAVRRGMTEVRVVDYTVVPPAEVRVPLDPVITPKENAERYFKRARKSKRAIKLLATRVPEVEREIEYLENALFACEDASTVDDLISISEELIDGGYMKDEQVKTGTGAGRGKAGESGGAARAGLVRRFLSSEGFEVLLGRSGAGNDLLVKRLASPDDIWFHAEGVPGSHVIIKVAGRERELTRRTMEEAAALAAWHSKARGGMKVDVIYAHARHVKKPRGAKPGLVTVMERKTIRVKPAELAEESDSAAPETGDE